MCRAESLLRLVFYSNARLRFGRTPIFGPCIWLLQGHWCLVVHLVDIYEVVRRERVLST